MTSDLLGQRYPAPTWWEVASLEDVASVLDFYREPINGKERQERINGKDVSELFPYYGATGQVGHIDDYRLDGKYVLLGEDGAPFLEAGKAKAYVVEGKVWVNNHAHILAPRIDPDFFCYYLNSVDYAPVVTGTTRLKLNQRAMRKIAIAFPPLEEQRRIVSKIEELYSELDNGVESLKTARGQLKTYRQSLLKAAFEGHLTEQWRRQCETVIGAGSVDAMLEGLPPTPRPSRWKTRSKDTIYGHPCLAVGNPETKLPPEWRWVPLVDVARMESGHTPSRRHPEWWDGDVPWIGIADARKFDGKVISETKQYTNKDGLANSAARLLPPGTVCVSRTASVGYVVEMGAEMATSQDFVNWVPSEAVTSAWLRLVFGAHSEYLLRFAKGTTHRTIYFPEWLSVHIGLPPLEEQKRIVEEVEAKFSEMDVLDSALTQSFRQAEALRQSILKRAFEGKLVAQDPDDEPASTLLERIRSEQKASPRPRRQQRKADA